MRINRVKIRNFRGFETADVSFHPNMTVVIGNNTAGKTSLLGALQAGIGAYLQSFKGLPGGKAYRRGLTESDRYLYRDDQKRDYLRRPESTRIDVEAEMFETIMNGNQYLLEERAIKWYRELTDKGSTLFNEKCAGELKRVVSQMEEQRNGNNSNCVLPVLLFFGTNRIDNQYRTARKVKERLTRLDKGYKAALSNDVDFQGAMEWLRRYDKNIKDGREFEGTREAFFDTLATAIPAMTEIELDGTELEALVSVTGRKPERHHYDYMSDGFKAMINIVSEIAYRCIQLNGFLGEETIKMTPGVVMIDEVDLYLHPRWQHHVLDDLQKAFPKVQFIVTTHSPFIVQSLKRGQLVSFDEKAYVGGEPFRESIEDVAGTRMGINVELRSQRFNAMAKAAKEFYEALDAGDDKTGELKRNLDLLEAEYSEDPAYVSFIRTQYESKKHKA